MAYRRDCERETDADAVMGAVALVAWEDGAVGASPDTLCILRCLGDILRAIDVFPAVSFDAWSACACLSRVPGGWAPCAAGRRDGCS